MWCGVGDEKKWRQKNYLPLTGSIAFSVNFLTCITSPFAIADMIKEDEEMGKVEKDELELRIERESKMLFRIQWWKKNGLHFEF